MVANAPTIDFDALESAPPPSAGTNAGPTIDFGALEGQGDPATKPAATGKSSGILANIGAGINKSIAETAGLPVDLTAGAVNFASRGVKTATGLDLGQINEPIGGSKSIERAMGLVGSNPENVEAKTPVEQAARSVGAGIGSMVVPGVGAEATLAKAGESLGRVATGILEGLRGGSGAPATLGQTAARSAGNAAIGASAGAGGYAAEAVVPDKYKPAAGLIGNLAGGISAGAGEAAFRYAFTHPSLETEAADRLLAGATDPEAVKRSVAGALDEITVTPGAEPAVLPKGVKPTLGQVTNDPGILQTENWARNQKDADFRQIATNNNASVVHALNSVAPETSETVSPGAFVRDQLSHLDAAQQSVVDAAHARAGETLGNIAPAMAPEDQGTVARGEIQRRYQPMMNAADQVQGVARSGMDAALRDAGGSPELGADADTVRQQYGAQLRQFVQEGRDARAAAEGRLWDTVRQNGDLTLNHQPTVDAVNEALKSVNPAGGDKLLPAEADLYGTIKNWSGPQDFDTVRAMRSNIGDAADTAFRAGDRRAGSRLLTVRNGIDASIESAVDARNSAEQAAVKAGTLAPENTMEAALASDVARWKSSRTGQRPGAAMADTGSSVGGAQSARAVDVPSVAGADGQADKGPVAAVGDPGMATPDGKVAPPPPASGLPPATSQEGVGNADEVQGDTGLRGNAAGDAGAGNERPLPGAKPSLADDYAAARAATRETHRIFDAPNPAGNVIARGPYGAPEKMPDSLVAAQFWNAKPNQVDSLRNFEEATGGKPDAIATLLDYAAFDLRRVAYNEETGRLSLPKYAAWMKAHGDKLSLYPGVRARFQRLATAQETIDGVQAQRDGLQAAFERAMGKSNATVLPQYFKRGPAGAEVMNRFLTETGGTPEAVAAMTDHILTDYAAKVAPNGGPINVKAHQAWLNANKPALSRLPGVADRLSTAAKAQAELEAATANKIREVNGYGDGAARFWLKSDPMTAVTNALSRRAGNDPTANIRGIMALVKHDPAATAGVKAALRDWLVGKGVSGKEAGNTGTNFAKLQTMQDLIQNNREALAQAFTPREMHTLDQVALALRLADRSISGSKAPIGPGTARDLIAASKFGIARQSFLSALMKGALRLGSVAAGTHMGGLEGGFAGLVGEEAARNILSNMRAARETNIQDLIIGAIKDPEQARLLISHATPASAKTIAQRLADRIGQVTAESLRQALTSDEKRRQRAN